MPRVLPLGLILPQSAPTTFQTLRVATYNPLPQFHKTCRVRVVSDLALGSPEPPDPKDANEDRQDKGEGGDSQSVNLRPGWKAHFFRRELLRRPIRPLRTIRPLPKYSYAPESQVPDKGKDTKMESLVEGPLPVTVSALPNRRHHMQYPTRRSREALLRVLAETHSTSEAYEAYETLLHHIPRPALASADASQTANQRRPLVIPYEHLHRLARLLSTTYPRTRSLFLRLLSVLTTLRDTGGSVFVWEWNALIDCAGKGWRKTTVDDYRAALDVFKNMLASRQNTPASRKPFMEPGQVHDTRPMTQPDIISFTTLLNIASRSLSKKAIDHATALLDASSLSWNHVTHMAKLSYLIRTGQLDAVREILREVVEYGLDLVTLNGCLWAYARSGQIHVALEVYELLRRNIPPRDRADFGEANTTLRFPTEEKVQTDNPILSIPRFALTDTMRPDKITYSLLIQAMCYHGDFFGAMKVFRDMVSTMDPTTREPDSHPVGRRPVSSLFKPTVTIYRAIFLGFARHAHRKRTLPSNLISRRRNVDVAPLSEFAARLTSSDPNTATHSQPRRASEMQTPWTLNNLDSLFELFLETGWCADDTSTGGKGKSTQRGRPSDRMIYWIMVAYAKTTNRDTRKMYDVWRKLDARFGYGPGGTKLWTGRIARLGKEVESRCKKFNVDMKNSAKIEPNG